jgi:hypothetical protein
MEKCGMRKADFGMKGEKWRDAEQKRKTKKRSGRAVAGDDKNLKFMEWF